MKKDILYEFNYYDRDSASIIDNFLNLEYRYDNIKLTKLDNSMLDSITKDSPIHILRALYTCKIFAICTKDNKSLIDKNNAGKILGYKSAFANIFIFDNDSISNEYLQARKDLYQSIMTLRKERQNEYNKEKERISNLSYEAYQIELKERQQTIQRQQTQQTFTTFNQPKKSLKNKDLNHLILESSDKNIKIIFLDKLDSSFNQSLNSSSFHTNNIETKPVYYLQDSGELLNFYQ